MAKATRLLGELYPVTAQTKLYISADMEKIIASIDADMTPANRDQAGTITAKLISSYRMSGVQGGPSSDTDFKQYTLRLFETYSQFPASIGWQSVDPGTGIPSKTPYWPKPFDIVQFCETVMAKRRFARVMAQRHITESKRRAQEREDERAPPTPEQKQRIAEMLDALKSDIALAAQRMDLRS